MNEINDDLGLPKPDIIETIDSEQLITDRQQRLIQIDANYRDVIALESEPMNINMQVEAYREAIVRQRINESAQANLLAFATKNDLDHLGDFYGLKRATGETDASYRIRIRERTKASSTAGSQTHYRSRAIEAAPLAIRDVEVDSPEAGKVRVSVLVKPGFETDEIVSLVAAKVKADDVRMLTDTVIVVPAEQIPVPVVVDVYLQTTTPEVVFDELKANFSQQWDNAAGLGWDVSPSWIDAQLHKGGVYDVHVIEPTGLISVDANQHAVVSTLDIRLKGRGY